MKKPIQFLFAATLLLALVLGSAGLSYAALQSYNSGFQVQNLSSEQADIVITFYNRDGTEALQVSDQVPADDSNTYFPLTEAGGLPEGQGDVPDGFDGSVVVSSNKPVAAIANVLGTDETGDPLAFGASYSGFTAGSSEANLPLLMKGNFGFSTWFSVQNTGSSTADITATYSDNVVVTVTDVAPGAAAKFEQDNENHADGWVGSAIVTTSAGTIAATAMEVGPTTLFAYDGFGAGSPNPVMPLVNENNFGFVTGIQVQNTGGTDTDVTIDYTPGLDGAACSETRTVPAGESVSFALYVFTNFTDPAPSSLISEDCAEGNTFIGSASVSANSEGHDLVAIINQLNLGTNKGAAYNSFDPSLGTSTVVFPLIMDRNFNYFTGMNVYNAGSALAAGDITCTVTGTASSGATTVTFDSPALGSGETWSLVNLAGNNGEIADGFVGSAKCVGPSGSSLLGSVNELNTVLGGDAFLVYEGFNQ